MVRGMLWGVLVLLLIGFVSGYVVFSAELDEAEKISKIEEQLRIANSQKDYWERAYNHPNRIHIETYLPDLSPMHINIDFHLDRKVTHFERVLIRDSIMEIVYSEAFKEGFKLQKELEKEQRARGILNDEAFKKYEQAETNEEKMRIKRNALRQLNEYIDKLPRPLSYTGEVEPIPVELYEREK